MKCPRYFIVRKDGEKQATPGRGRGYRYGFTNQGITTNQMRR
jgi:hypothetical protein